MVSSAVTTVKDYLAELPEENRKTIEAVHKVLRKNMPKGYVEQMQYGMITYAVPLKRFAETYNGQPLGYVSVAAQKNHYAVYLMGIYGDERLRKWFESEYKKSSKRLDVGKCCVRFKRLEDLPLDVVGEAVSKMPVDDFVALYEKARGTSLLKVKSVKRA
jgi:hypothetical protein